MFCCDLQGKAKKNVHRTVSVILNGLDLNLSSAHRGDAPSLRKVRGFYELIQLLGRGGETVIGGIRGGGRFARKQAEVFLAVDGFKTGARSHT